MTALALLPGVLRTLTGFLVVMFFFLPEVDPSRHLGHVIHPMTWGLPMALIPLAGFSAWVLSRRHARRVPVPGFVFAIAVVLAVGAGVAAQGFTPLALRAAGTFFLPWLLVPILLQEMTVDKDRRSLRALMGAILAVVVYHGMIQSTMSLPSLARCLEVNPQIVLDQFPGIAADEVGLADLRSRLTAAEPFAHFSNPNTLGIALLVLTGFAWAAHFSLLTRVAGLCSLWIFLDLDAGWFLTSKGLFVAALVGLASAMIRFHPWKIVMLGVIGSLVLWSGPPDESRELGFGESGSFRQSYWKTARNMSENMGPVGAGQYPRFAEMARVDGGHFARDPHNGFLRSTAELGLPAALALFAWLASLYAGQVRIREVDGPPRKSFLWGAIAAMGVVLWHSGDAFTLGYAAVPMMLEDGTMTEVLGPSWPLLDHIAKLGALCVFLVTLWTCLHASGRLRPAGYVFSAAALLVHMFIDVTLYVPGMIVLASVLAALGWERTSSPWRWTWLGFPMICLGALVTMPLAWNARVEDDPVLIERLYRDRTDWPGEVDPSVSLLTRWHELDPANPTPIRAMRFLSNDIGQRRWLSRELATRPSDPNLHMDVALWLFEHEAPEDLVRRHLRRARQLDEAALLPRYGLDDERRQRLEDLSHQLEEGRGN